VRKARLDRHAVAAAGATKRTGRRRICGEEIDVVAVLLNPLVDFVQHETPSVLPIPGLPADFLTILSAVQTPDFFDIESSSGEPRSSGSPRPGAGGVWAAGERITWVAGLVLALSSFMGWYSGSGVGVKLAVIGWHSGTLGKLVFFLGVAVLVIVTLREFGFELPPSIPESLVVLGIGALAAVFVLIRIISIPDSVLPADGRGIGIWISLLAALGVILGGVLRAAEEL
jgi:hypothetical protein